MKNVAYSLTLLCMLPMHAMDKEITYLFANKNTKSYDDRDRGRDGYDNQVYIDAPVFYHLVVQALQSGPFKHDSRQELLKRIRDKQIEDRAYTKQFIMTQKDAFHRLLRYIPATGAMHVKDDGGRYHKWCEKIYPVLVNGVSSNLQILVMREAFFNSDSLNSLCRIVPNGNAILSIHISSDELLFSDDIFAKYKKLIEQP